MARRREWATEQDFPLDLGDAFVQTDTEAFAQERPQVELADVNQEVRARFRHGELVLEVSAARVLEHHDRERAEKIDAASRTLATAAGTKQRFVNAITVASSKRNMLNSEVVKGVREEAEQVAKELDRDGGGAFWASEGSDAAEKQRPAGMYTKGSEWTVGKQQKRERAALAVVMARSEHRAVTEEGKPVNPLVVGKLYRTQSRMLHVQQFPIQAGDCRMGILESDDEEPATAAWVSSERGGRGSIDRAPSRLGSLARGPSGHMSGAESASVRMGSAVTATSAFVQRLRTGLSRARSDVSSRWPGNGLQHYGDEELEEVRRIVHKRRLAGTCKVLQDGKPPENWRELLLATYPEHGMTSRNVQRFKLTRADFLGWTQKRKLALQANGGEQDEDGELQQVQDAVRVCPVVAVNPGLPKELDRDMTSVHGDNRTVRYPSETWAPPVQLWEPFVVSAILSLYFYQEYDGHEGDSDIITEDPLPHSLSWHERHMEKFLKFTRKQLKTSFPCPILKLHLNHPYLQREDSRFFKFMCLYFKKKFEPYDFKGANSVAEYVRDALFDSSASPDQRTPRIFIMAPYVLDFMRSEAESPFEGQYADMIYAASSVGLLMQDVVQMVEDKTTDLAKQVWSAVIEQRPMPQIDYDQVHRYLDPSLVYKRHGGYSLAAEVPHPRGRDLLIKRLVGATLEEIVTGQSIDMQMKAEILRADGPKRMTRVQRLKEERLLQVRIEEQSSRNFDDFFSEAADHQGAHFPDADEQERLRLEEEAAAALDEWEEMMEQCIDPDDTRFMPLGCSLVEAFLVIHGMVLAMDRRPDMDGDGQLDIREGYQRILRTSMNTCEDRHAFTAAVIIDLYMREKVDVWAWQLNEGGLVNDHRHQKAELPELSVSQIYRVFQPPDAPLWKNEAPRSHENPARGPLHWLEMYVNVVEDAFALMEVPAFIGAEPAWVAVFSRGMLRATDDEADQFRLRELQFMHWLGQRCPLVWRLTKAARACMARLCCCCPRRASSEDRRRRHSRGRQRGGCWPSCCGPSQSEDLEAGVAGVNQGALLEVYEFQPPALPHDVEDGPVGHFLRELEAKRLATHKGLGGDAVLASYAVGDKIELYSSGHKRWLKAKVTLLEDGWVTVAYRAPRGGRKTKRLPQDHEYLRQRRAAPRSAPLPPLAEEAPPAAGNDSEGEDGADGEEADREDEQSPEGEAEATAETRTDGEPAVEGEVAVQDGMDAPSLRSAGAAGGDRPAGTRLSRISERSESEATASSQPTIDGGASREDGQQDPAAFRDAERMAWWERLKMLYCDAYFLMFEEGAVYYEDEQEVALWRSQLLMFFFCLQLLFEVAGEGRNGLERVLQAVCPPFAKLPLQPPRGMEAAGAVVRGIAERARLARDERPDAAVRNFAVETGEFQERVRSRFETSLFLLGPDLLRTFDEGKDGSITLKEFIRGCQELPKKSKLNLRSEGMPDKVLNDVIRDLAKELFFQLDADGSGALTAAEIKEALAQRQKEAQARKKAAGFVHVAASRFDYIKRQIPGTKENREWSEAEKRRRAHGRQERTRQMQEWDRKARASMERIRIEEQQRWESQRSKTYISTSSIQAD